MRKTSLLLCAVLTLAQGLAMAQTAGKIISIQGRAEVKKPAAAPWLPAATQQMLDNGDTVRTLPQSRAVVLLADETQVKLNANTILELRSIRQSSNLITRVVQTTVAQGDQSLINLAGGQLWLRSKLKPANVKVTTPAVTAAIRGTEFDLKVTDDGESVLTMLEGLVDFRNDQGAIMVGTGEQARCRIGQAPTKSVILRPRDAVQWVLYYPGAVSPADYSFLNQTADQLKATLASAEAGRSAAPSDRSNLLTLARAQHDLGQRKQAEETLASLLAGAPQDGEALTDLAWLYLESRRTREAVELLNRVEPKTDRATTALAMAYYQQGDAQAFFDTIRRVDPQQSSLAATQRAFSELLYGNVDEARRLLEAISSQDPNYALAQGLLSNVRLAQNDKSEALAAAQRAVQAGPRSPSAYLDLSLAQQSHFQIPEALQSARRALELDPEFVSAQVQVAKLLFSMGDTRRAEQIARDGLARNASEPALNSLMGFILLAQAKTKEAVTYFQKSISQDSTRGEPFLGLGIAAMRRGETNDATQSILIASTLEPQISIYDSYLGKAFYDLRRFEMAFDALGNAESLDDKDPTPHLYAGIFDNDMRLPGRAIRELTRSIELNNNRAVYRSRFLLDEDRATRNVNLATSYNQLYLSEWGNYEALKSQMADPTNSSSHIFLAQTFLNLRGRTQAAGSEQLLARLLLPVNANAFNSFNDYTALYEQPRAYWTFAGQFGNFNTYAPSFVASGGTNRLAYGVTGNYFQTDGFRPQNDDRQSITGVAQMKFAITPHSDVLLLYTHNQSNGGDTGQPIIDYSNNPYRRVYSRLDRGELGYHLQIRPGSDVVAYFSGERLANITSDDHGYPYNPTYYGIAGLRTDARDPDLNLQAAHLYKVGPVSLRYGLNFFEGRSRFYPTIPCCLPEFTYDDLQFGSGLERQDVKFKEGYVHADYTVHPKLVLTGATYYDWANKSNFDLDPTVYSSPSLRKWSPQAGFFFTPFDSTALRFAFIRSLQTDTRERLSPTNIAGFVINQNDPRLSRNESYSFGWDQRIRQSAFFRGSAFYRDRDTAVLVEGQPGVYSTVLNHFHGADLVWDQLIGEHFSLVPSYSMFHGEDVYGNRHEHDGTVKLFYISPHRFWVSVGENYIHQAGFTGSTNVHANFCTTDFNAAYEFPRKRAVVIFNMINIFDHRFALLVDPLSLDARVPARQISGTFRINF